MELIYKSEALADIAYWKASGQKAIEVLGPFPEIAPEVEKVHAGFWNNGK